MNKLYSLLLITSLSFSQDMMSMDQGQMNDMMAQMQKMQACMARVDFSSLADLQERSFTVQQKIDSLCESDKRDEAQEVAINFTNEIFSLPAVVTLKECTKDSAMGKMMNLEPDNFNQKHVCEGEKTNFGLPNKQRINW